MAKKVRDAIRIVERDGWYYAYTRGGHRQYHHPTKPGKVTISGHPGEDVSRFKWGSMMRQAGLKVQY